MKNQFQQALSREIIIGDPAYNISRCKELAEELKITDVVDPSGRQIGMLAELLYRVKEIPELEIIDIEGIA
jgi:hypothetical protein